MASPSSTAKLRAKCFPGVPIEAITNGVHAGTWTAPAFRQLFDRYIPTWREDNYSLRGALGLPPEEVWAAHLIAKHELLEVVRKKTGLKFDPGEIHDWVCATRYRLQTRGPDSRRPRSSARRLQKMPDHFRLFTPAKLILTMPAAKPSSNTFSRPKRRCAKRCPVVFLDDYNMDLGGKITAGVDLWLNTPQFPWKLPAPAA